MNNEEKRLWGEACRRLQGDSTFQKVVEEVRGDQIKVLEDKRATQEQVAIAHGIACGVREILAVITRGVRNAEISERKS